VKSLYLLYFRPRWTKALHAERGKLKPNEKNKKTEKMLKCDKNGKGGKMKKNGRK